MDAYGELWTITDVATRQAACDGVLAAGCTYTDPSVHAEGVEEIIDYMTRFQENAPSGGPADDGRGADLHTGSMVPGDRPRAC